MSVSYQKALYENPKMWCRKQPETVLERARLTAAAVPADVQSILEVGAGNGTVINALANPKQDPVALDISFEALRIIKGVKRVRGSGNNLPFASNCFDMVLACELLEHLPVSIYKAVIDEIARVSKKYILITVPFREKLEWNLARCPSCGCIFNGAYHVRSFEENELGAMFENFECIRMQKLVSVCHPDRTFGLELFVRQHLAMEYLYYSPAVKCPLCSETIEKKTRRNWVGWIAAAMRYGYRILHRKNTPLWYLAVFEKTK